MSDLSGAAEGDPPKEVQLSATQSATAYVYVNVVDTALGALAPSIKALAESIDETMRDELARIAAHAFRVMADAPSVEEAARRVHELLQGEELDPIADFAKSLSPDQALLDALIEAGSASPVHVPDDAAVQAAGGEDSWISITVFLLIAIVTGVSVGWGLATGNMSEVFNALVAFLKSIPGN